MTAPSKKALDYVYDSMKPGALETREALITYIASLEADRARLANYDAAIGRKTLDELADRMGHAYEDIELPADL